MSHLTQVLISFSIAAALVGLPLTGAPRQPTAIGSAQRTRILQVGHRQDSKRQLPGFHPGGSKMPI